MWVHKNTFAIGGLENVGYAPMQDQLLVLSTQGEGIFDCVKGEKIARYESQGDWWTRFNEQENTITGFAHLADTRIQTCGLYGGDYMSKLTADGWALVKGAPEPEDPPFEKFMVQKIYLVSPDKKQKIFIDKDGPCELRAFGFSDTGNTFIVALSCDLVIYSRV